MEILRALKSNRSIDSVTATLLISSLEIQIISIVLIKANIPIQDDFLDFMKFDSLLSLLVLANFALNFTQSAILTTSSYFAPLKSDKTKTIPKSTLTRTLQFKHYITFVQIINFNTLAISSETSFIQALALINIFFTFFQLYSLKIINESFRFIETNFIRRRNNSILTWFMIVPIVVSLEYDKTIYACGFLVLRSITQFINNFTDLQNQTIRKLQFFYPLISCFVSISILSDELNSISFFSNQLFILFACLFSVFCTLCLTKTINLRILRFYLKKSNQFFQNYRIFKTAEDSKETLVDEKQVSQNILQLRIMVNIFFSRMEFKTLKHYSMYESPFHYDHWWKFFNHFVMNHKIYCETVNCICQTFAFTKNAHNSHVEQKIFIQKTYDIIKKNQSWSSDSLFKKLKIIENYFLIQIEKKPFKAYYQLVNMFALTLTKSEILEIETMLAETRNFFQTIFIKQKIRNSNLELEPVFELETQIKRMRKQMNQLALDCRDFYDMFASSFVEIEALKAKTKLLTRQKKDFSDKFDYCLKKFDKSLDLMTFAIVYFKFFDEYTGQLNFVEKKAVHLHDSYYVHTKSFNDQDQQIFNPIHSSVKIDLVYHVGKVLSISKNICKHLGYDHRVIEGQKVNKLMPYMFSRVHDRFLTNFIQKGSLKMLKQKEAVMYARNSRKFIVPISLSLKVDFSQFDNLCAMALVKPTSTKSEFILMNNYCRIEEITQGLYKRLFQKTYHEEYGKIKRLWMSKMLLSLNYYLKEASSETNDTIRQGLLLMSESEQYLADYFKFPEMRMNIKNGELTKNSESNRSSVVQTSNSSQNRYSTLDFSEDMVQYTNDMKDSLKDLFKKINIQKIFGYRVSYRLKDCVTSQFRYKILEIINIYEEESRPDFIAAFKHEIVSIAEFFGFPIRQYQHLTKLRYNPILYRTNILETSQKSASMNEIMFDSDRDIRAKCALLFQFLDKDTSQQSSNCSVTETQKKKSNVMTAFGSEIVISNKLQNIFRFLILLLTTMLIVISVFSIRLKGNYVELQHDNLMITNLRISYLTSLGIQELKIFYETFDMDPPSFVIQKKAYADEKMKQYLKRSVEWISLSSKNYEREIGINYFDREYSEQWTLIRATMIAYATFLMNPQRGKYITDSYANFNTEYLNLTGDEELLISQQSAFYKFQIDIVVILYSLIMIGIAIVCYMLNKISNQKENKIIDLIPFFKASSAKSKVRFYSLFYVLNKESETIDAEMVQAIFNQPPASDGIIQDDQEDCQLNKVSKGSKGSKSSKSSQLRQRFYDMNPHLIRVLKNKKPGFSRRIIVIAIIVFSLCVSVIAFSEYFFGETDSKFKAYLQLKGAGFLVQLIPARAVMLYFININKVLHNDRLVPPPYFLERTVHNRIFEVQTGLASSEFYGTEMQQLITSHFNTQICNLVPCKYDSDESHQIYNQTLYYLIYRTLNAFEYMRKIKDLLPKFTDPKAEVRKWMNENSMYEILKTNEFILELMRKNQEDITNLFTNQIANIGEILFSISLTLIPILIISLLFAKGKYMEAITDKLQNAEGVFKHVGWDMLRENPYALNYFEDKLKMARTF